MLKYDICCTLIEESKILCDNETIKCCKQKHKNRTNNKQ